jgi:hypothetical protein
MTFVLELATAKEDYIVTRQSPFIIVLLPTFFFMAVFTVVPVVNVLTLIVAEAVFVNVLIFAGFIIQTPFGHRITSCY